MARERVQAGAVYARISKDRDGEGLGVARQEELCRKLAAEKGWPVAEVYADNDVSAYSGKARPAYEQMLRDLEAGACDAVVVLDQDRLTRHPMELESFIDLADRCGIALANVSGDVDLSTSEGRFRARLLGNLARHESEKKSERIRRERSQSARMGKPHGGQRAFGFEPGGLVVREAEAALIREAAQRALAGESARTIVMDWNKRGIRSARGGEWYVSALKQVLSSPRIAGLRAHNGEIVGEAQWPAILDRGTWERLQPLFRRQAKGRPPTNLLTSLLTCGVCGRSLHSSIRKVGQQRRRRYACNPAPGSGRCGRVTIEAEPIETLVTEAVLTALDGDGLQRALNQLDGQDDAVKDIAEQLRADELALEQLAADYYTDRLISRAEYLAAREGLQRRIDGVRARLDTNKDRASLRRLVPAGGRIRDAWDSADVEWRRSVIGAVLERIEIEPAHGKTVFDPVRVRLSWRF